MVYGEGVGKLNYEMVYWEGRGGGGGGRGGKSNVMVYWGGGWGGQVGGGCHITHQAWGVYSLISKNIHVSKISNTFQTNYERLWQNKNDYKMICTVHLLHKYHSRHHHLLLPTSLPESEQACFPVVVMSFLSHKLQNDPLLTWATHAYDAEKEETIWLSYMSVV